MEKKIHQPTSSKFEIASRELIKPWKTKRKTLVGIRHGSATWQSNMTMDCQQLVDVIPTPYDGFPARNVIFPQKGSLHNVYISNMYISFSMIIYMFHLHMLKGISFFLLGFHVYCCQPLSIPCAPVKTQVKHPRLQRH